VDLINSRNGSDPGSGPERRHQIPGLRQTPYLKIYLLRCDESETYKATCKKQIRDWIKSRALPRETKKGQNNQESHDAFEWLIVHVVVEDTPAAAQPQTSKDVQLGNTDGSDSITNNSKRPGKSPSTVFEKLRADFNGSSKSTIDHVAQICVRRAEQQISADSKDQVHDLVEKLKVTILTSFDLRVRQYEEDIREKDSQRNLPGWNFNTFFILKEGLAKGFENVGLFDDALVGYDELALGLDVIVREHLERAGFAHGVRFLPFSDELKGKIQACLKDTDEGSGTNAYTNFDTVSDPAGRLQRRDYPLDASKSPFRELILANDISIFDFRLYLFSRQLSLLLRKANAFSIADHSSLPQSSKPGQDEHFLPLAEACQRAVEFITNGVRTLRHDLELALQMKEEMSTEERNLNSLVISNFILSWMYVSALQILAQTASPNLILPQAEALPSPDQTVNLLNNGVMERQPWSLSRTPSPTKSKAARSPTWAESNLERPSNKSNNKTGAEELAGARAELYLLARTAVEQIGGQHGWTDRSNSTSLSDVQDVTSESDRDPSGGSVEGRMLPVINGLQHLDLRNVFHSRDAFKDLFGCLTMFSYRHFLVANRKKSAEKVICEFAILKYEAGEYEAAASYLNRIASDYRYDQWTTLEAASLQLYANCLRKLSRHGEYVTSLLTLLGQNPGRQRIRQLAPKLSSTDGYLADLWVFSKKLNTSVTAKLSDFFSVGGLAPQIRHYQDRDGFFIPLGISFFLGSVELSEGLQMVLSPIYDSRMPTITLYSGQPVRIGSIRQEVELSSNLCVSGWYAMDSLQTKVGNIVFLEDYIALRQSAAFRDQPKASLHAALRFFVYPPERSLQAEAAPAPYLHLAQPRSLLVEMKTGWNEIQSCTFSMKSGTAGLRLRLHEAKIDSDDGSGKRSLAGSGDEAQAVILADCSADSNYKLLIPYTIETADVPVINAKLDVEYFTAKGKFVYASFVTVNTILPISVNVQDIFKEHALFSRFTISPSTLVPLRLLKCDMQGSPGVYSIESDTDVQGAMDVFPKQPASLMYKFTRQQSSSSLENPGAPLALSVKFSCLDETVLKAMERRFIKSITASPIAALVQPLCAHLLLTFRSQWSAQDLEVIGLCHEIEVWPYEDLGWEAVLTGFDIHTRDLARTCLKEWHADNAVMPLYGDSVDELDVPWRLIEIPVDIPTPIVATASFELNWRNTEIVTIGEVLLANLHISSTRSWAVSEISSHQNGQLGISYEVLAPAENWIVGGMRKGNLQCEESVHSVPVILLPQRTGHLLLPSIEVKCHKSEAQQSENSLVLVQSTEVPCEVDIKTLARSVHVVSGLRETVVEVAVDAEVHASEKRSWLVGSKCREGVLTDQNR
jgi:trafficking protein particle complex subunit 10